VLAGAATVTERIRLATTVMVLPARNEVQVAKQVAVIDRLSDGRVDLGLGVGGRADDYEVLGATMEHRGGRLRRQVAKMREMWAEARRSDETTGVNGPAPLQEPGVPIWIGGASEAAVERALQIGDGFIFGGGLPAAAVAEQLPKLKARVEAMGKHDFTFAKIQYCAVGPPERVLDIASRQLLRYYRNPNLDASKMVVHGDTGAHAEATRQFAATGLDVLIYLPQVPSLDQVELLARDVLPAYR
jgi:alkanesulfonate monooxygenase SsuD/methylene tetrahydromethanopterin reductase-like flavin-dependent oxidoreductase (luciferase family)